MSERISLLSDDGETSIDFADLPVDWLKEMGVPLDDDPSLHDPFARLFPPGSIPPSIAAVPDYVSPSDSQLALIRASESYQTQLHDFETKLRSELSTWTQNQGCNDSRGTATDHVSIRASVPGLQGFFAGIGDFNPQGTAIGHYIQSKNGAGVDYSATWTITMEMDKQESIHPEYYGKFPGQLLGWLLNNIWTVHWTWTESYSASGSRTCVDDGTVAA